MEGSLSKSPVLKLYRKVIPWLFALILLALLFGLGVGVVRTFLELGRAVSEPTVRLGFKELVTNVLSLVIVLELLRAFVDYFEVSRIRLEVLLEIGVAFALRELMLNLFAETLSGLDLLFWTLAILALVVGRTLAVHFSSGRPG